MARVFVGWLQHSGETSVDDREVKRSGLDRDLERVIAYASWVGIRPSAVRIMTAISPQRRLWNAETRTFGTGLFYLFVLEKLTIEKEFIFFSPRFPGGPNCLLFKGAYLPSGKLATSPVRYWFVQEPTSLSLS
ncbi:hypothetical protein AVEN_15691-1 [Araneus ventricosus]|uniref:Uncharacterized protein n=1 Tax=Araneus ventricosus TaxID=182803 RepID=A0A4Y2TXB5_ARAVE|nr:hypothetical protein AVEN_15691-1 [Araneus ventricosus]